MFDRLKFVGVVVLAVIAGSFVSAQTLNLPPRPSNAAGGADFKDMILPLSFGSSNRQLSPREVAILGQVLQGNVPNWMRSMTLVTTNATIGGTNHTISYYVIPDYLAIGSDQDYFLMPTTPLLAQRIADALNCSLTTAKMVNDIWKKAPCKLSPSTQTPVPEMIDIPYYDQHNTTVRGQRFAVTNSYPLGTLTGGDKKDVIIANKIYTNFSTSITNVVVIYGWHQLNGSPIQPVYNGHEETYADYSHGIRLVQMNVTVDGQPNTVTNVLKNTALAALLSDDATFAGNVINKPRYTPAAMAPSITEQPASQTMVSNSTATFTAFAVGDTPLTYQWRLNGMNIAGATNKTLTLTNVQSSAAGSYTVVASNSVGIATSIPAILNVTNSLHPILFADDFETNSSARWDLFWGSGNGVSDYTVDWAFDYSHEATMINGAGYFIRPAPNSHGTSHGVRLTVNNNDTNGVIAGVNLYPKNVTFSNDYALKFDMWVNYPGNAAGAGSTGSTEFALCGMNHLGTRANWAATTASATDGLWFAVDGEGGVSADYRAFVGNLGGVQTELLGPSSGLSQSNSTASIYQTLFPSSRFETAGAPGKNWVEVELRQVGSVITWLMNGTVVAQRTNTSSFTSGKVMIGFMDTFTSIASPSNQAFILFDNVRVENLAQTLQSPSITSAPQNTQTNAGANVSFTVAANGSAPLLYQWSFNDVAIPGATNPTLQLTNLHSTNGGTYSVTVTNSAGLANASVTLAVVSQPPQFSSIAREGSGHTQLSFSADNGTSHLLETSTNLVTWTPISVLAVSNGSFAFTDIDATNFVNRFYRARSTAVSLLTDFESYENGASVLFQSPGTSGSTSNFVDLTMPEFAFVTNAFPTEHASSKVLMTAWTFKTGTSNPWVRLTTFNAADIPNPVVLSNGVLQFDAYCDHDIYVTLGLRETNPTGPIGSDGGTTNDFGQSAAIEWVGVTTENSTPPKGHFVPAGQWTTLNFFIPYEPVRAFTGNGSLDTTTGKVVLEHLAITSVTSGAHTLYIDNVQLFDLAE